MSSGWNSPESFEHAFGLKIQAIRKKGQLLNHIVVLLCTNNVLLSQWLGKATNPLLKIIDQRDSRGSLADNCVPWKLVAIWLPGMVDIPLKSSGGRA